VGKPALHISLRGPGGYLNTFRGRRAAAGVCLAATGCERFPRTPSFTRALFYPESQSTCRQLISWSRGRGPRHRALLKVRRALPGSDPSGARCRPQFRNWMQCLFNRSNLSRAVSQVEVRVHCHRLAATRTITATTRPITSTSFRYCQLRLEAGERGWGTRVNNSPSGSSSHQPQKQASPVLRK
jgi:hypothetical protein